MNHGAVAAAGSHRGSRKQGEDRTKATVTCYWWNCHVLSSLWKAIGRSY